MFAMLAFESPSDRDKFEFLYSRYKNLLFHKAKGILNDHMLAEDAVSECYLRVYKNLHKIGNPNSNSTIAFLVTIVKNVALTMYSRNRGEVLSDEYLDGYSDGIDFTEDVLSDMAASEIYALLDKLESGLRDVFLLKYAHDMNHREIGVMLGLSENNVTVRLYRAKKKLASMLEKEDIKNGK